MDTKTIVVIVVALLAGLAVGYALSLPVQQSLQNRIASLEEKLNSTLVQKIKARGVLVMGTSADWPPFEYVDAGGNIVGIDVEIARRIAQALGVRLEVRDMKFAALIEAVKNGQVDIVLADMTPTAERETIVDFSIPYYFSKGNAVIVLKSRAGEFKGVNDLKGRKIGVQLGTIQEEWAQSNLGNYSTITSYDRVYPEMVMALKRGDVDALIVGDIIAGVLMDKDPDLTVVFYAGGTRIGAAVAMPQGAEDLKYEVNKVLEGLLESGEINTIFESEIAKWLGTG